MVERAETIEELAVFFTGPMVTHQSMCLQLPTHQILARKFFETREKLGITGYMSAADAKKELEKRL